jgi:peptide-methionine (R)-S-oxide reductase|tara:strand:- start:84 stop:503 length:420 start_codon:yes stop_codon:yes gene_type:complete
MEPDAKMAEKIKKSEDDWRAQLTDEQFHVTRQHGTERAFTGEYNDCKDPGTYHCICCGHPLFDADHKFDSGTGWPSFYQPLNSDAVETQTDSSMLMQRTEVHCARCDAHLGHVFPDGPMPTGQRYCMNSVSMKLEPKAD